MQPTRLGNHHLFYLILAITTVIKVWLASAIPLIGDEAYFYQWGKYVDWGGFYDHPPMVGWWLWGLQQLSSSLLVLRLPAIALWIAIVFGMMDMLRRLQPGSEEKVWLLGSLFLLLPFTWSLNLITTDIPLIFFLFFSGYAFLRGEQSDSLRWHAISGVLLGLALLSKYFAGLLAIAYAVYFLFRGPRGWLRLVVIAACALPFMLLNIAWNSSHCWNNILFNLFNRNQGSHFSLTHLAIYIVMMIYLVTPWTGWRLVRTQALRQPWQLASLFIVPFALFFLLSFYKSIGLHWVLAFLPFVFIAAGTVLTTDELRTHSRWNIVLGIPHLVALILLAYLPSSAFEGMKLHTDIVMHRDAKALISAVQTQSPPDSVMMTSSYSSAALLAFHADQYVPVFGEGSFHARFDDNITNFSDLNGKTIVIVGTRRINETNLMPYFTSVSTRDVVVDGAHFWVAQCQGFKFEPYRENILKKIAATYYRMPSFLPLYGCRFTEQYGFERQNR